MTPDDVLNLKISDVIAAFEERRRFKDALEEIVRHAPYVTKEVVVGTLRSIAVEALEKGKPVRDTICVHCEIHVPENVRCPGCGR